MRSWLILGALTVSLAACGSVHNPPPQMPQPTSTVILPPASGPTTIVCPPGATPCRASPS